VTRANNNNNNSTNISSSISTPTAARTGRSYSNPSTARRGSLQLQQQQQQHGAMKKSNSITSSMVINSMVMNSTNNNTNSGGIDNINMNMSSIDGDGFDIEAKNSMYDEGIAAKESAHDDESKDMYLKFLMNKDHNRGTKVCVTMLPIDIIILVTINIITSPTL